jgi:uncharacterized protein involved in exopolysaccharide biosynthesis
MSHNNQTEMSKQLQELEARNKQLEAQVSLISSRFLGPQDIQSNEDEIDLKELWAAVWKGKWIIIGVTFIFSVISLIYASSLPNEYKSTAILASASQSGGSNLSKLSGQFGGLASLAGINLSGGGGEDKSVVAMEILKTWGFLEKFIENNNIQVEVFAAKGWDRAKNELIIDSSIYDQKNSKWVRPFSSSKGQTAEPNTWELYESFKSRVSISKNDKNGLISLSVEHYSPFLAKEWTDKLVKAINQHLQKQDKVEAEKSIMYLEEKIRETKIADMKSTFYKLIEEQRKTLMLAEVSDEYALKTLSEAKIPRKVSQPKRKLVVIFSTIIGGIFGIIIALFMSFRSKRIKE